MGAGKEEAYRELGAHMHEACRGCEFLRNHEEPNVLRGSLIVSVGCANRAPHCPDENPFLTTKTDLLGVDMPMRDYPFNPDELHHLMTKPLETGGIVSDMLATVSTHTAAAGVTLTRDHVLGAMKYASTSASSIERGSADTAMGVLDLIQRGWALQYQAGDEAMAFGELDGAASYVKTGPDRFVLAKSGMMDIEVSESVAREVAKLLAQSSAEDISPETLAKEKEYKARKEQERKEREKLARQLKEVEQEAVREQLEDLGFGSW